MSGATTPATSLRIVAPSFFGAARVPAFARRGEPRAAVVSPEAAVPAPQSVHDGGGPTRLNVSRTLSIRNASGANALAVDRSTPPGPVEPVMESATAAFAGAHGRRFVSPGRRASRLP